MSASRGIADRPDLDQGRANLPLFVDGALPMTPPLVAYEARLQIHNAIGDCTANLVSGNVPPGTSVSVDNTTQEVVIRWPAYVEQAAPIENPGFEEGFIGWDAGAGWEVTTDNSIAGIRSARYSQNWGNSELINRSRYPVIPGQAITAQCAVRQGASSAGNAGAAVMIQWRDDDGNVVRTNGGNAVMSASNNAVFPSEVTAYPPAEATQVNLGITGIRNRQNLPVWVDSLTWDHESPAAGIAVDSTVCMAIEVRDSGGRLADWQGCVLVANDPYQAFVVMLLRLNEAPGATTFADSSTYNRPVTTMGGVVGHANGAYFPGGDTDYLYAAVPDQSIGNQDFTFEGWLIREVLDASKSVGLIQLNQASGTPIANQVRAGMAINSGASQNFWDSYRGVGSNWSGGYPRPVILGPLFHFAMSKQGDTCRFYANGVEYHSQTNTVGNMTAGYAYIGAAIHLIPSGTGFRGWMRDVRLTIGVSRYNANFTPTPY